MIPAKLLTGEEVLLVEWVRHFCVSAINSKGELNSYDLHEIHFPITNKAHLLSENFPSVYIKPRKEAAKQIKEYNSRNKPRFRVACPGFETRKFRNIKKSMYLCIEISQIRK